MKTKFFPLLLLLCVAVFGFTSCGDDDDDFQETLNYDGDNDRAPFNGVGLNTFAAYFPASELQDYAGRRLSGVTFWLEAIPSQTNVVIFGYSGNDAIPGDTLYSVNLTQRINNANDWIDHIIPGGLDIPADGLWLAVETTLAADGTQAIGCDAGNNYNPNGDRMRTPTSGNWSSFNAITGSETINWNIRGILATE